MEWMKCKCSIKYSVWNLKEFWFHFFVNFRGLDDDPEGHAEMQLEQALDDNDLVYHDNMIAANSWWKMNYSFHWRKTLLFWWPNQILNREKKTVFREIHCSQCNFCVIHSTQNSWCIVTRLVNKSKLVEMYITCISFFMVRPRKLIILIYLKYLVRI